VDWNRVEGNWKQVKGKIKEQWGKLTDDDLDVINGKRDQLEGKIQERYGYQKDQATKEIDDWYGRQRWWSKIAPLRRDYCMKWVDAPSERQRDVSLNRFRSCPG
jgi:uncharacterized protein YjbJ (UPF0337 family)